MVLWSSENSRNTLKEVRSPIPGYEGQSKAPRFVKKCDTDLYWKHLYDNFQMWVYFI